MWLAFSIVPIAFLFLKVFRLGVQGVALIMCVQYFLWMAVNYILLRKQKILGKIAKKDLLPDFSRVGKIISYGLLLAAQMLLCVIAEVIVSLQANRYLSVEYIAVIAVSLPIQGVLSGVTSSMCTAFIPQNYKAGNSERLKSFMRKVLALGVGYAVFCFVIYASIGEWYYYRLFQDMAMAAMGSEYWFWYGLSIIPVAIIGIVRVFFDSIDKGSISMLSGIGELLGRIVCGFWLIPMFGNIGRSLASLLGWGTGALFLLIAYAILRKSIYRQCEQYKSV